MLDFELLRAFVAVADCGGFHRAAERLNLTQSTRSEEHTSELQSRQHLVCRLLLEKKKDRRAYRELGRARLKPPLPLLPPRAVPLCRLAGRHLELLHPVRAGLHPLFFLLLRRPPRPPLFPYTTLFR